MTTVAINIFVLLTSVLTFFVSGLFAIAQNNLGVSSTAATIVFFVSFIIFIVSLTFACRVED